MAGCRAARPLPSLAGRKSVRILHTGRGLPSGKPWSPVGRRPACRLSAFQEGSAHRSGAACLLPNTPPGLPQPSTAPPLWGQSGRLQPPPRRRNVTRAKTRAKCLSLTSTLTMTCVNEVN